MRTTHVGACPLDCPDTCSWVLEAEDGRVVSIRGNKAQPFTHGALCGKVNRYLDHLNGDRLLHPLVRTGAKGEGRFARVGWDEALDRVAAGLQRTIDRHGPQAILPFFFAGSMGMIQSFGLPQRILYAMGTSRLDTTICTAAWRAAANATLGGQVCIDPETLPAARLIVIWGANPLSTGMHVWKYVNEARAAGAHVVCIDPLRSPTAERCDEHVAPRPGTDAALALGLMRVIRDAGAADEAWLASHTVGWPELSARLDEWPVERAATICGLPVEVVRGLGERLAATRPSAIMIGLGLQRHGGGGSAVRAIMAIPALTGDWRHVGGGVSGMTGDHFPSFSAYAGAKGAGVAYPRSRVVNMSRLGHALHELDDPPVDSLLVFNCNPAATSPDARRVRAGMLRDDLFTVVLEQRMTDTADLGDIVLPATMQPEHADLHDSYGHLYLSWNEPAVPAPGECLPNSEILRRIAARLGFDHPALQISDLDFAAEMLGQAGIELDDIRAEGFLRIGPPRGSAPFADGGFPTASGRVELVSQALDRRRSRRSAHLRAAARGGRRRSGGAVPAGAARARRPVLPQLDVRPAGLAPRQDGRPDRLAASVRRRGAGAGRRRHRALPQRPRRLDGGPRRQRCDEAGRLLHAQDAVAEAVARRRERERLHPGTRHRHRRRSHVPRQPRRGLGSDLSPPARDTPARLRASDVLGSDPRSAAIGV